MTLGDIIKKYRLEHDLSMDSFAEKSGISKSYISLLEKNKHPKTGKSIAPSIQCIKQAADAMKMDFNILFAMLDSDVVLEKEETETKLIVTNDEVPEEVLEMAKQIHALPDDLRSFLQQSLRNFQKEQQKASDSLE